MRQSRLVDHPSGKAHQEIFESLKVLWRKTVLVFRTFQHSFETCQPHLSRAMIDLKRKMPGAHSRRAVPFHVYRRTTEQADEESRRLSGSRFEIVGKEVANLGFSKLLVEVRHHPVDVVLAHFGVNFATGPRALWRASGRRVNDSSHLGIVARLWEDPDGDGRVNGIGLPSPSPAQPTSNRLNNSTLHMLLKLRDIRRQVPLPDRNHLNSDRPHLVR